MAKRKKPTPGTFDFDAPVEGGSSGNGSGDGAVPLHEAAQSRYLNYALSVITSRALPVVIVSALCGITSLFLLVRGADSMESATPARPG